VTMNEDEHKKSVQLKFICLAVSYNSLLGFDYKHNDGCDRL